MKNGISLGTGVLWVLVWFGFMLLYTALDVILWRKLSPPYGRYWNLLSMALCTAAFLLLLARRTGFQPAIWKNVSLQGLLLAAICAVLFYFVLDKGLDPVFERLFPASEGSYQQSLQELASAPIVGLLHVCVLAPVAEEILMRDFLLGGLSARYGSGTALLVSAALFALLHFNMVQTLSALVCGAALGLLYLRTGSVFCCILAHAGYNLISYAASILPLRGRI